MMTIQINKRIGLLAVCVAIAAIPATSQAKRPDAMDNCIQAFVAEQLPKGHDIEIVKRQPRNLLQTGCTRPTKIQVQAKGKFTGTEYGSAVCQMNPKGEVLAMTVKGERTRFAQTTQSKARGG
jgi:hypothetical protein